MSYILFDAHETNLKEAFVSPKRNSRYGYEWTSVGDATPFVSVDEVRQAIRWVGKMFSLCVDSLHVYHVGTPPVSVVQTIKALYTAVHEVDISQFMKKG